MKIQKLHSTVFKQYPLQPPLLSNKGYSDHQNDAYEFVSSCRDTTSDSSRFRANHFVIDCLNITSNCTPVSDREICDRGILLHFVPEMMRALNTSFNLYIFSFLKCSL